VIAIDESIDIACDPAFAFRYLSAIERYPDWLPGIASARQTSPGEVARGTTFRMTIAGPARAIEASGEATEVEQDRAIAVRSMSGPARIRGRVTLEAVAAGTRLRVTAEIELSGAYRFAQGMVARQLRAGVPEALGRLKARLEQGTGQ
jgi:carbon monoxide dehydrogenase subunit G